jgi:hypothetical protein
MEYICEDLSSDKESKHSENLIRLDFTIPSAVSSSERRFQLYSMVKIKRIASFSIQC